MLCFKLSDYICIERNTIEAYPPRLFMSSMGMLCLAAFVSLNACKYAITQTVVNKSF